MSLLRRRKGVCRPAAPIGLVLKRFRSSDEKCIANRYSRPDRHRLPGIVTVGVLMRRVTEWDMCVAGRPPCPTLYNGEHEDVGVTQYIRRSSVVFHKVYLKQVYRRVLMQSQWITLCLCLRMCSEICTFVKCIACMFSCLVTPKLQTYGLIRK